MSRDIEQPRERWSAQETGDESAHVRRRDELLAKLLLTRRKLLDRLADR
jgi:hypothetical protein